jgi:hypothetical protein
VNPPDRFGLAVWALHDAEKNSRRPTPPAGVPGGLVDTAGDIVTISNPARFLDGALDGAMNRLTQLVHGQRNAGLNNEAMALGHLVDVGLGLDYDMAASFLEACADTLWPDRDTANVRGTIRSGLTAGMRQPLQWVQGTSVPAAAPFTLPGADGTPMPAAVADGTPVPALITAEQRHGIAVAAEIATQRARREAKRLLDEEEAAATFRVPPSRPTLADELKIPPKPVSYAIDELLPAGGNALLTAQYKAGKTSVVNDLIRAYCDSVPFLGKYHVDPAPGRIAVFNYEVGEDQYREWLRALGLQHPERAVVLNLRGFRVPVTTPTVEDWVVAWLQEHEVSFWVVDPFARAFTGCGDSENDNTAVGAFLDTLDVIKARAGVRDLVLPTHTGRMEHDQGQERSRGATRLEDWADVRWLLTKGDTEETAETRFFRATGRDVEVPEGRLDWDEADRSVKHAGGDRKHTAKRQREQAVLMYVQDNPGSSQNTIEQNVVGKAAEVRAALKSLVSSGHVQVATEGRTSLHTATGKSLSDTDHGGFPSAAAFEAAA